MKFPHWLVLFLSHILLFACEKSQPHYRWDDKAFVYQQDVLFYQGKPFSGVLDTFFPNHQKSSERVYENGKLERWETQWYENGNLSEKRFYRNNQKTGHHFAFWQNGHKRFDYHFVENMPVGEHKQWYQSGQLFSLCHYNEQGQPAGRQSFWYENGKLKANFEVVEGRRFGLLGAKGCMGENEKLQTGL
jgi:antitoxin component YwqK of YwqJK toxin-antitoxin module